MEGVDKSKIIRKLTVDGINPTRYERKVFKNEADLNRNNLVLSKGESESPREREFKKNKKFIINELRRLVIHDPCMERFMQTGNRDDLKRSEEETMADKRKWSIFLRYVNVWDDDLVNLGYLELQKIYAVVHLNQDTA